MDLFVKQLKAGKYSVESPEGLNTIPRFTVDDIGDLLKYAEDLTVHPCFHQLRVFSPPAGGKLGLGGDLDGQNNCTSMGWQNGTCEKNVRIMKAFTFYRMIKV